ncbi:MAG: 3-hydroxyacyl-CoA dehydrogenase [Variovorax sp.]|nr:MAG: 3-hydroxyacyl-CoA dehydrogenase [Variovorax sp.]
MPRPGRRSLKPPGSSWTLEGTMQIRFDTAISADDERAALTHLEQAEREAANIPSSHGDDDASPIRTIGVLGAGTMGTGIALNFLNAGMPVMLVDNSPKALARGLGMIRAVLQGAVDKGRIDKPERVRRESLLSATLDDQALVEADLVIEAVFEDMALKRQVCARLGMLCRPGAILATNTSTLDVDALALESGRPERFVGMHFFSPAHVMRLLEVVRGAKTASDVIGSVMALAQRIGKVAVVSGVCYGFIGNRMAEVYMREAEFMLMEGIAPSRIDGAVERLGMAMGPCRMLDMAGIDVGVRTVIERGKSGGLPDDPSYRAVVRKLFALGRHGQKTGLGYYRYEGRTAVDEPATMEIAATLAREHAIAPTPHLDDDDIARRLLLPLINEGMRILTEGIAMRPGDIDVVWTSGYGFPRARGGPMYMARSLGLDRVRADLQHYANTRGDAHGYWAPSFS